MPDITTPRFDKNTMKQASYLSKSLSRSVEAIQRLYPGIIVCLTIAFAATFLSNNYNAPVMIYALLVGMAFTFLATQPKCTAGIKFSSTTLLRIGIALLGLRITLDDIASLGIFPIIVVTTGVLATIIFGFLSARIMGLSKRIGIMTSGAVAICGASAALAIASVMPDDDETKSATIFTVISVTTMSTVAMVLYPIVAAALNLNAQQSGLFLGGTIHDVAQVVGAGYSVSGEVGELSTFIKLFRVAMLIPVVLFLATFVFRSKNIINSTSGSFSPNNIFPYFLVGFIFFVLAGSFGIIPSELKTLLSTLSTWLLVIAISALGVKTSLSEISSVGWKPLVLILISTLFIAIYIIAAIKLI